MVALEGYGYFWSYFRLLYNQWTHVVLTYIGPNRGQGIRLFKNGVRISSKGSINRSSYNYTAGDGRVVVGRLYVNRDYKYASVEIDELIFFNQALQEDEVKEIYNMYE